MADAAPSLDELLVRTRSQLVRILEHRARGVLRFESADDLAQAVHVRALEVAQHFVYIDEPSFMAWLLKVSDQVIARQHRYWKAQKRRAAGLLRISTGGAGSRGTAGVDPPASQPGASTFAMRREALEIATHVLAAMRPRDQEVIRWTIEDVSLDEIAERLEISYAAAAQARTRALERFRLIYQAADQ